MIWTAFVSKNNQVILRKSSKDLQKLVKEIEEKYNSDEYEILLIRSKKELKGLSIHIL